ncbi:unnamed protein product [Brassica rapa]|uniref:Uncharacterized protein n=2 Tax=Brassica TaxID=3705 RepID=A0A3P5ZMR6_BRACM|nr:unnamed protein product [Brassica napus]CAG7886277.1 unnamed protein product [Brassica rapa]VDC73830.1 unnamed protein product [Brassica rapa]
METKKRQLVVSDIVLIGEIGGTAEEDAAALIKKVVLRSLLLWYCWTHSTTGKRWNNKVKLIRFLQSHRRRWKLNLSDYVLLKPEKFKSDLLFSRSQVIFWSCEKSMFFCKKCSIFGIGIFFKKKIDSSDPLHQ